MPTLFPAERFFLQRGECPDCFEDLETREYAVEDAYRVRAVEIEYCNECDGAKDITVSTWSKNGR